MLKGTEMGNSLWKLPLFAQGALWRLPDINTIKATMRLAWAASSGHLQLVHGSLEQLHVMQVEAAQNPQQTDAGSGYDEFMGQSTETFVFFPTHAMYFSTRGVGSVDGGRDAAPQLHRSAHP
jgi:hypothetical protein